jgi:hypothetical protein
MSMQKPGGMVPDGPAIKVETALELCKKYCEEKGIRAFSQCWGCLKFSKGNPAKMCFYGEGNRGCKFVNELFDGVDA